MKVRTKNQMGSSVWVSPSNSLKLPLVKAKYTNPSFSDIKNSFAKTQIIWCFQYGITSGTDSTHYSPKKSATRAQMVTFLYSLAGKPQINPSWSTPFSDIKDSFAQNQIKWAYNLCITSGTDSKHFSPNKSITRAQMVAFLYRLAGNPPINPNWKTPFSDIKDNFAQNQIRWAYNIGLTSGTDSKHFSPNTAVNREQTAAFLNRFAKIADYTD
jgi:hypothetical protein